MILLYYYSLYYIIPPFNPGRFGGVGKARNFWEIFHLTTWNIPPPTYFLGFLKEVGRGSSGCPILAQRWYGTPFHFEHTYIYIHTYTYTYVYIYICVCTYLQSLTCGSSFHQTLGRVNLPNSLQSLTFSLEFNQAWRDHYKPEISSWNISRCGEGTPTLFGIFHHPPHPPLKGRGYYIYIYENK